MQRQVLAVHVEQRTVVLLEIQTQFQFIDRVVNRVVDMPVVAQQQAPMALDSSQNSGCSAIAVHRQGHRNSCLDTEADPSGANDAEDFSESPQLQHSEYGGRFSC